MSLCWAHSSAWIEWLPAEQLVEGSSPSGPAFTLGTGYPLFSTMTLLFGGIPTNFQPSVINFSDTVNWEFYQSNKEDSFLTTSMAGEKLFLIHLTCRPRLGDRLSGVMQAVDSHFTSIMSTAIVKQFGELLSLRVRNGEYELRK